MLTSLVARHLNTKTIQSESKMTGVGEDWGEEFGISDTVRPNKCSNGKIKVLFICLLTEPFVSRFNCVYCKNVTMINNKMYRQGGKQQRWQKWDLKVITIRTRFSKKPKESGHSAATHENWQTLRSTQHSVLQGVGENVAGNQRENNSHCENHFECFFTQQYFCGGCHI